MGYTSLMVTREACSADHTIDERSKLLDIA